MADSDWRRMYEKAAKRSAYFAARLAEAERLLREALLQWDSVAVEDFLRAADSAAVIAAGTEWKSGAKVVTCAKCGEGLMLRATGPVMVLPHECTAETVGRE